jgi:hypothetical protein
VIVDTDRAAPQPFPYTVESVVFQVTGQVRFRPLSALDLERSVEDIGPHDPLHARENVQFAFPHHSRYKGLRAVRFPPVFPDTR